MWQTILGSVLGKAGGQPQQAGFNVEEEPVPQKRMEFSPDLLTQEMKQRRRQEPYSILSGMQNSGGYYK